MLSEKKSESESESERFTSYPVHVSLLVTGVTGELLATTCNIVTCNVIL